jgi:hypothetical protein
MCYRTVGEGIGAPVGTKHTLTEPTLPLTGRLESHPLFGLQLVKMKGSTNLLHAIAVLFRWSPPARHWPATLAGKHRERVAVRLREAMQANHLGHTLLVDRPRALGCRGYRRGFYLPGPKNLASIRTGSPATGSQNHAAASEGSGIVLRTHARPCGSMA